MHVCLVLKIFYFFLSSWNVNRLECIICECIVIFALFCAVQILLTIILLVLQECIVGYQIWPLRFCNRLVHIPLKVALINWNWCGKCVGLISDILNIVLKMDFALNQQNCTCTALFFGYNDCYHETQYIHKKYLLIVIR